MIKKIKILVVTYHPWRDYISVGNTLSNIFDGMEDRIEFANVYVRDDKPSNKLVGKFFNIVSVRNLGHTKLGGRDKFSYLCSGLTYNRYKYGFISICKCAQ